MDYREGQDIVVVGYEQVMYNPANGKFQSWLWDKSGSAGTSWADITELNGLLKSIREARHEYMADMMCELDWIQWYAMEDQIGIN